MCDTALVDLRKRLSGRPDKNLTLMIAREAMEDNQVLKSLLKILYCDIGGLGWRAAWVLEKIADRCPELLVGERHEMSGYVMRAELPHGLQRLLLSILYHLPEAETIDVVLLNYLLETMCRLQEPPGAQALAMKLAARMCSTDKDLHEEFCHIVRNMDMEYYSSGVRAVVRNCLSKTKKKC